MASVAESLSQGQNAFLLLQEEHPPAKKRRPALVGQSAQCETPVLLFPAPAPHHLFRLPIWQYAGTYGPTPLPEILLSPETCCLPVRGIQPSAWNLDMPYAPRWQDCSHRLPSSQEQHQVLTLLSHNLLP